MINHWTYLANWRSPETMCNTHGRSTQISSTITWLTLITLFEEIVVSFLEESTPAELRMSLVMILLTLLLRLLVSKHDLCILIGLGLDKISL